MSIDLTELREAAEKLDGAGCPADARVVRAAIEVFKEHPERYETDSATSSTTSAAHTCKTASTSRSRIVVASRELRPTSPRIGTVPVRRPRAAPSRS